MTSAQQVLKRLIGKFVDGLLKFVERIPILGKLLAMIIKLVMVILFVALHIVLLPKGFRSHYGTLRHGKFSS